MKLVNLLESLCFSMETVHQVPLPPMEKQEGHSALSRLPVPSSTLSSNQGVTHRSGVWTLRGPPEYCLSCPSNQSLASGSFSFPTRSAFRGFPGMWLMVLHAQAWLYCAQMPPRVPDHKPVHTHWNRLPFVSFCAFNTFLPLGLLNFTFIECNAFYQVLLPQSLWQVFKCDVHVPVV